MEVGRMYVEDVEPTIEYSGPKVWADVEADEATFDKLDLEGRPRAFGRPIFTPSCESSGWALCSAVGRAR